MEYQFIDVKLTVEDKCNPCADEAIKYVEHIIMEAFAKEARQDSPRAILVRIEAKYR